MGRTETQDVVISGRVSKRLFAEILVEQQRIAKLSGIEPSINEVVRLLLERGLKSNGKRR
jgi:hypothetical protein